MVHGLSTVSKLIKSASMDKINENQEIGCSWTTISLMSQKPNFEYQRCSHLRGVPDASLITFMHNA
jgi:hypothetical protein